MLTPRSSTSGSWECANWCQASSATGASRGEKKGAILGAVYEVAPCVRSPAQVVAALFFDATTPASASRPSDSEASKGHHNDAGGLETPSYFPDLDQLIDDFWADVSQA